MIRRGGPLRRGLWMLGGIGPAFVDLARGLRGAGLRKQWLLPLALFLFVFALVLVVAGAVEPLAPFIYAMF